MENLTMCRICLAEDVRMHLIGATHLHKMYEALTTMPFATADHRPLQVCYICCARLQNCYKLKMTCLQSEELFSQMLNKEVLKLKGGVSKQELSTVQVVQMSFDDMVQPLELCNQVKIECEDSEAATNDTVEDTGRVEDYKFSKLEEYVWIDIEKKEWDEQTSAPVPKTISKTTQTSLTLNDFNKIEEPKTDTEIPLEGKLLGNNLLLIHNTRDYDLNRLNKSNSLSDNNDVEKEVSRSSFGIELKLYSCDNCRKCFQTKYSLEQHIRTHTGERPYQCNVCNKCFSQKCTLSRHFRIHTDEKPYQCNVCDKCFTKKDTLHKHSRTHTGEKPYQCNVCQKCFIERGALNKHIIRMHSGNKPFQCNVCRKCFSHKFDLDNHIPIHTGAFQCNVCGKRFHRKCILDKHIRTHNGEKPYRCKVCKKCFIEKSKLVQHVRTHTGEKPYECEVCKKCFTARGVLNRHLRTHTPQSMSPTIS